MIRTTAYRDFQTDLARVNTILGLVKVGPAGLPGGRHVARNNALLAGAVVLIVAAYEGYVRDSIQEFAAYLTNLAVPPNRLPEKLLYTNLDNASNVLREYKGIPATWKSAYYSTGGTAILSPEAFAYRINCPDTEKTEGLFKAILLDKIWAIVQPSLSASVTSVFSGMTEASIRNYVDEIISARHKFAHGARGITIGDNEVKQYLGAIREVINEIERILVAHINAQEIKIVGQPDFNIARVTPTGDSSRQWAVGTIDSRTARVLCVPTQLPFVALKARDGVRIYRSAVAIGPGVANQTKAWERLKRFLRTQLDGTLRAQLQIP